MVYGDTRTKDTFLHNSGKGFMRFFTLISLIFLALFSPITAREDETPKENIAINQLKAPGLKANVLTALTDALRAEINKVGKYNVMERTQMGEILKEQGFQISGACDEATCAIEMGQLLGVRYLVLGSLGKVDKTYTLNVRLVDVGTGEIVTEASDYVKGSKERILKELIPTVALQICGKKGVAKAVRRRRAIIIGSVAAVAIGVPTAIILANQNKNEEPEPGLISW